MSIVETFLIAIGLSMDAFAIAISIGLSQKKYCHKDALTIGLYFGAFQAIMPIIWYYLASWFAQEITTIDHRIAFILLSFIWIKMIIEGKKEKEETKININYKNMIPLAIATSIDALAVGVSLAFLDNNIFYSAGIIGICTCILSMIGVCISSFLWKKANKKAEYLGGIILIIMGMKILVEHLGIL